MERQSIEVNVQAMLDTMDFSKDQYLRPRDIIVVPSRGEEEGRNEFLALGEVKIRDSIPIPRLGCHQGGDEDGRPG
jgi:hypothetical protein